MRPTARQASGGLGDEGRHDRTILTRGIGCRPRARITPCNAVTSSHAAISSNRPSTSRGLTAEAAQQGANLVVFPRDVRLPCIRHPSGHGARGLGRSRTKPPSPLPRPTTSPPSPNPTPLPSHPPNSPNPPFSLTSPSPPHLLLPTPLPSSPSLRFHSLLPLTPLHPRLSSSPTPALLSPLLLYVPRPTSPDPSKSPPAPGSG